MWRHEDSGRDTCPVELAGSDQVIDSAMVMAAGGRQ